MSQAPIPAHQASLQAFNVTPTVSGNPYAAQRGRVDGEWSTRSGPGTYAGPLLASKSEEVIGSEGDEPKGESGIEIRANLYILRTKSHRRKRIWMQFSNLGVLNPLLRHRCAKFFR